MCAMLSILFFLAFTHHEDAVGGRVGNNLSVRVDMGKRFLNKTQVVADPVLTLPTCISPSVVRLPKSPPIDHSLGQHVFSIGSSSMSWRSMSYQSHVHECEFNNTTGLQIPRPAPLQGGHGITCRR